MPQDGNTVFLGERGTLANLPLDAFLNQEQLICIFPEVFSLLQNLFIHIVQRDGRVAELIEQENQIHLQICFDVLAGRPIGIVLFEWPCINTGHIFVSHFAGIGGVQTAHCFPRVDGKRHTFIFCKSVIAHFQIVHTAVFLKLYQRVYKILRRGRVFHALSIQCLRQISIVRSNLFPNKSELSEQKI